MNGEVVPGVGVDFPVVLLSSGEVERGRGRAEGERWFELSPSCSASS